MTSTPVQPGAADTGRGGRAAVPAPGGHSHDAVSATGRPHSATPTAGEVLVVETEVEHATAGHLDRRLSGDEPLSGPRPVSVLLYSDDVDTRATVRLAVGKRLAADLPPVEWTECATPPAVIAAVDGSGFDVLILDGESSPAGGLGLCKQLKDEKFECPPVLVLTGRPQDAWLATWSRADAAVPHPLDPRVLAEAVTVLARRRRA
jgi:CheY-like chemotaxis protein